MTVLRGNEVRGFSTRSARKYMVGAVVVLAGIGAALGISQLVDNAAYEGALVERSMAMEANVDALIEGGYAMSGALDHSPMVERSLAIEEYYRAKAAGVSESPTDDELAAIRNDAAAKATNVDGETRGHDMVKRSLAMEKYFIEPAVKRSLAMQPPKRPTSMG